MDDAGDLQAFEYTTIEGGVDLAAYPAFVAEFCAALVQRGMQHKFGLAIKSGVAEHGFWIELVQEATERADPRVKKRDELVIPSR